VVTNKPLDKLQMVMAEQTPAYKRPSQYIFVSEIPKTKQQKISRTQLALRYVAGEWT
jgi:long-chain acyl-CoA synthetase